MFELFRKVWVGLVSIMMAYYAAILVVAAMLAIVHFVLLAIEGRVAEAAIMYILVAAFGGVVAFGVWIHCDATASSRRLEKHMRKNAIEDEEDDEETTASPSESIRPAPGP